MNKEAVSLLGLHPHTSGPAYSVWDSDVFPISLLKPTGLPGLEHPNLV